MSAGAPLTVAEARRAELPKLASSVRGYQPGRVSAVTRQAGTAIRMTYLADAPRNAVTGKAGTDAVERYVFFHKGREIVLTLSRPQGRRQRRSVADRHGLGAVDVVTARLEADSLFRFFHAGDEETLALQGVSLRVDAGQIVAVTGPSGSGKSTLLACLAGLDEPDGGTVRIDGERLSRRSEEERARMRAHSIGMLFQQANLVGHLSVAGNVALTRRLAGAPAGEGRSTRCWIVAGSRHAPTPSRASSPAASSRVPASRSPWRTILLSLLADEPTGELDRATAGRVLDMLRDRAAGGGAVLLVTHSPEVAAVADREIRLRDGRVAA